MYICNAHTFAEFENIIEKIKDYNRDSLAAVLFRGHADIGWKLTSTLERRWDKNISVIDYYRTVFKCLPEIELFTGQKWPEQNFDDIYAIARDYDQLSLRLDGFYGSQALPHDAYLAYLRHHGYPSPLLDWSRSPYVAAHFAFQSPEPKQRAIYVLCESPENHKLRGSDQEAIYSLRKIIKPHRRHYLQQSEYTVCVSFDVEAGWRFASYASFEAQTLDFERFESDALAQDVLIKIILPSNIRIDVLRQLDSYNLNSYSLLGSEESLMETMAFREIDARRA